MRNGVLAAISLIVAITAAALALRPLEEPPEPPPVSPTRAPDTTPTALAATATPTTTPTPTPTPTPPPARPTPTPTPSPTPPPPSPTPAPPTPTAPPSPTATPTPPPEPPLAYEHFDASGGAPGPGSYSFLVRRGGATRVAATYEEARTDATIARFNVFDTDGVSRADRYESVAVGDLVEWRRAEDCWTRYQVTSTTLRGGAVWEFGVSWMTYAFTGCSGALAVNAPTTLDLGPLPDLGDPELPYPIRHGPWQFVPKGWTGAVEPTEERPPAARHNWGTPGVSTVYAARRLPFWRDPAMPISWALASVTVAAHEGPHDSYRALYRASTGAPAVTIEWYGVPRSVSAVEAQCLISCDATRVIAGRPARVSYSPIGPFHDVFHRAAVWVYDPATQVEYVVREDEARLFGGRVDGVIDIARSLFEDEPVKPDSLSYSQSRTDDSAAPGTLTFLDGTGIGADPVTTYNGLRGGEATVLLIHTSDIDGVSHARFFDSLSAGDAFEWWQAEDCWVRFRVAAVLPDPSGVEPRKLFAVQSRAFAYTGCMGAVPANALGSLGFGPLSTPGGPSLDVPIGYGPWHLVPAGWSGASYAATTVTAAAAGQFQAADRIGTSDLEEARLIPHWREPALPAGWTFTGVVGGDLTSTVSGYCATFGEAGRRLVVEVCGTEGLPGPAILEASWDGGAGVREFRTIHDRPALVAYSPPGPNHLEDFRVEVSVYDAATGIAYTVFGYDEDLTGSNVEPVIAIARSLFEGSPAP